MNRRTPGAQARTVKARPLDARVANVDEQHPHQPGLSVTSPAMNRLTPCAVSTSNAPFTPTPRAPPCALPPPHARPPPPRRPAPPPPRQPLPPPPLLDERLEALALECEQPPQAGADQGRRDRVAGRLREAGAFEIGRRYP